MENKVLTSNLLSMITAYFPLARYLRCQQIIILNNDASSNTSTTYRNCTKSQAKRAAFSVVKYSIVDEALSASYHRCLIESSKIEKKQEAPANGRWMEPQHFKWLMANTGI